MLKELKSTRQIPGESFRRWYTDSENDLIVWIAQFRVVGFQLLVPGGGGRIVITWHEEKPLSVAGLDDGEGRPGRPKMSPVLIQHAGIDPEEVRRKFRMISDELPAGLVKLVELKLSELESVL